MRSPKTPEWALDALHGLPDLAAEVAATQGAPNPAERPLLHRHTTGPASPSDESFLDVLRHDGRGPLFHLTQCTRAVAEDLRDSGRPWPDLTNPPGWSSECAWLIGTFDHWKADPWLAEYVPDQVEAVHAELARVARWRPPPAVRCLKQGCAELVRPRGQDGPTWLWPDVCPSNHRVDRHAFARLARELDSLTVPELSERLGVPERTLFRWASEGWLAPVRNLRPRRYLVLDALRLAELGGRES